VLFGVIGKPETIVVEPSAAMRASLPFEPTKNAVPSPA